jgi:sigma-54 dependent transcriptional regulator, acetoin dehydrogenase operon transcriptional activator AcoR
MIRINATSSVPGSGTARHPFIDALASDEAIGQRMVAALAHSDPRLSHLRSALLAALLGDAHGAEVALIRAHRDGFGGPDHLIEAAWAFVSVEGGHPARAATHLDRAFEALVTCENTSHGSVLVLLRAQALFAGRGLKAAREVATEARCSLPESADTALRTYAAIVCANLALEDGDPDAAERELSFAAPARSGILAARVDVLRARLHFARTGDARSSALDLDRAINRLTVLGARRDLALACFERALQAGFDPAGSPGRWLARAQSLLGGAGRPNHLQALPKRRAGAGFDPSIGDGTRMAELAAATHELASVEEYDAVVAAVARLGLAVCPGIGARVVRTRDDGSFETLAASGAELVGSGPVIAERLREALFADPRPQAPQQPGNVSIAVALLGPSTERLALVVERDPQAGSIGERDLEQLAVYASFAAASLVRARSHLSLREADARDAATLGAIRDGVLVLDRGGRVRSLNQAAAAALGVRQEETVGRRLRDLAGLAPLALAVAAKPSGGETVTLPHGEIVVHTHAYEGGTVAILRDVLAEHAVSKRAVGSTARFTFDRLVGEDPAFVDLISAARRAATCDLPILVTGESGTGKELLAQAIHNASGRAAAPFVGVNVTAIPRDLVESELFGYEGGTFTGARASGRAGKFELAGRGTLLLDEIGDMPLELQGKLLRVLQEKHVQRLGSVCDVQVRARVIATTHRDLLEGVSGGGFRLDLYHRLRVVHLRIPPLRERKGDILLLAQHQLHLHCERTGRAPIELSPAVAAAFERYHWPGNVRELCNVVEGEASLLPAGENVISRVPHALCEVAVPRLSVPIDDGEPILPLDELERRACSEALQRCAGNVTRAAQALGVAKNTLYAKMRRYGLIGPEGPRPAQGPKLVSSTG